MKRNAAPEGAAFCFGRGQGRRGRDRADRDDRTDDGCHGCPHRHALRRDANHHLAEVLPGLQVRVRVRRFIEAEHAIDYRLDPLRVDHAHDVVEHRAAADHQAVQPPQAADQRQQPELPDRRSC
jgi:hypothetical protein